MLSRVCTGGLVQCCLAWHLPTQVSKKLEEINNKFNANLILCCAILFIPTKKFNLKKFKLNNTMNHSFSNKNINPPSLLSLTHMSPLPSCSQGIG